ncbi:Ribosomal protein L11 methyltransferase [Minicystis rosea]|nr:Ribosomal protein L11 methyltransferase [Minicystis rosea]
MSNPNDQAEPRYPFVAVDVDPEQADEVGAALFELGAMGVEERDDKTLVRAAASGRVTLVGSFESREAADAAIAALAEVVPDGVPRLEEVVGDAWRDAWKEHFEPFALTSRITVAPPWAAKPAVAPSTMVLELEPGRAFGTGLHATTSLVAEILDAAAAGSLPLPKLVGEEVLDVGTGSGILAFVALLYGAARALGVDTDADVIEIVYENADRNGLRDRVEAHEGGIESVPRTYPWVLANIEARVLLPLAADIAKAVAPGGALVLSGILGSEHDDIVRTYTALPQKLRHVETRRRGDAGGETWVAIAFVAA